MPVFFAEIGPELPSKECACAYPASKSNELTAEQSIFYVGGGLDKAPGMKRKPQSIIMNLTYSGWARVILLTKPAWNDDSAPTKDLFPMKHSILRLLVCGALVVTTLTSVAQIPSPGADMLLVKSTAKEPNEVVDAIKAYSEQKNWQFIGANMVKNGEVTLVKVCIPQVGKVLWPLGLQISAMLPCGNVGVYQEQGETKISMLHPAYMQVLYPHAEVEKAVKIATPLLLDMLESIAK